MTGIGKERAAGSFLPDSLIKHQPAQPAGIVTIGAPFAGPASVNEKMIIRNEKICFDR